jgi:hypothetical protein
VPLTAFSLHPSEILNRLDAIIASMCGRFVQAGSPKAAEPKEKGRTEYTLNQRN